MRHLIIKNVGPIKNVDIELKRFNILIGAQSSGKSTIAKILSTCSWVEKEIATTQNPNAVQDAASFKSLVENFHKMVDISMTTPRSTMKLMQSRFIICRQTWT